MSPAIPVYRQEHESKIMRQILTGVLSNEIKPKSALCIALHSRRYLDSERYIFLIIILFAEIITS